MNSTQIQSQAVLTEEGLDPFNQTDNQLAQKSSSITSADDILDDQVFGSKIRLRENPISDDHEVLLELNTEEQEQFEVLDSAEGEDDKSQGATSCVKFDTHWCLCVYVHVLSRWE